MEVGAGRLHVGMLGSQKRILYSEGLAANGGRRLSQELNGANSPFTTRSPDTL